MQYDDVCKITSTCIIIFLQLQVHMVLHTMLPISRKLKFSFFICAFNDEKMILK